jgi:triosephosphate isomerase (TIM)
MHGIFMKRSLIVVNLKTYQQGKDVLKLCRKIERVDRKIIVGVQVGDIYEVRKETKLKIYSQHVDPVEPGRNTGFVAAEGIRKDGAVGVMLNHSEHPLELKVLKKSILRCKEVGLKTFVFAGDLRQAKRIEKLGVDYICWEPAELVGGKISVSSAKPEFIEKIGKGLKTPFLVGAGVHSAEDVRVAMKYGASGVALSSAVTTAKNPGKVLRELVG